MKTFTRNEKPWNFRFMKHKNAANLMNVKLRKPKVGNLRILSSQIKETLEISGAKTL